MLFRLDSQFSRFLQVGILNTAVGYGLFAFFIWLGLEYPIAIGLATLGGILFNFQSVGRLVFKNSNWSRLGKFTLVYCLIYSLNVGGIALMLRVGINVYFSNALLILPLALVAYLLQQKFVFNTP